MTSEPITEAFLALLKKFGVKKYNGYQNEVEFFEPKPESSSMALDPVSLAKALQESMPPDEAMLFAATEPVEEKITE
jgi:hypothetical protein